MRSRFEVVWCPQCRPPRRKTVKTGCCGRGGLRFGHNGARHCAPFARKPLNMQLTPRYARKPLNMRLGDGAHAQVIGLTCGMSGPGACHRAQVRMNGPGPPPIGPTCAPVGQDVPFPTSRANFFAEQLRNGACWASPVAPPLRYARCWAAVISYRTGNRLAGTTTSGWA